jgi:hypothetical protein
VAPVDRPTPVAPLVCSSFIAESTAEMLSGGLAYDSESPEHDGRCKISEGNCFETDVT